MKCENELEKGMGNEGSNEFPFEQNETKPGKKKSREELEKLTGAALAEMAHPLQDKYNITTLKSKSKNYLIDIILGVEDKNAQPKKEHQGKAAHNMSESHQIVNMTLGVLTAMKQKRLKDETQQLEPVSAQFFASAAVNKVDEARANETISGEKMNGIILGVSATTLIIDSMVGFENIPHLFTKFKRKLSNKNETTSTQ